ncbi:Site-specific integrase-like protein [[Mycoplasma] cavipharyngis]|uniref:hypothetical protein n=1 Tax=[Mycoplasma] cavipharyngis TaxID=92757 RepID=UPI003703A57B
MNYQITDLNELIELFLEVNYRYKKPLSKLNCKSSLVHLIELNTLDIETINNYFYNSDKWNDNTKRTKLAHIATFLKWLSSFKKDYIDTKKLLRYQAVPSKKEEFSASELEIIRDTILNVMENQAFYVYFEMLLWNGCRLGELFKIDWDEIKKTNYSSVIMALKNGNSRTIDVPKHLIPIIENEQVKLKVKYQSVKNWFSRLQKIIKTNYKDWYKPISSHCPRVHRATYAYLNGMTSTEISVMYGAKNFHTFQGTYIKGKAINKTLIFRANQDPMHLMNDFEKDQEISKLRKMVELQKNYINQINQEKNN